MRDYQNDVCWGIGKGSVMVIRNNVAGLRAYNANRKTVGSIKKNLEKLSSGYRINRAADDAAGLGVSQRILAKVTELDRCENNALEGIDLARTADAALQEVNDMLKRARSLCIQAENGTYSDQERKAISEEMNQIFSEIDRISAGSYHNSICLFRGDIGQTYHDEYDEHFTPVGDVLQMWGELDYIEAGDFDVATPATPATATFKLDDSIDFSNVDSLDGKSITIGRQTFCFTRNSYPSGSTAIYINNNSTVKGLLQSLTRSSDVSAVAVNEAERTVTLTAELGDLSETIQADGKTINSVAKDGDGETINGTSVSNPAGDVAQVDGSGSTNNGVQRSNVFTGTFYLGSANLTQDDVDNLEQNTLHVYNKSISFTTGSASGNQVQVSAGMTRENLGKAIASALNTDSAYKAECVQSSGNWRLNVTYTSSSNLASYDMNIHEAVSTLSSTNRENGTAWTASALNVTTSSKSATPESGGSCTVTLPSIQTNTPFAVYINGTTHLYYNSDNNPLTYDKYTSTDYSSYSGSLLRHDMKGKTEDQIRSEIVSNIKSYANGRYSGLTVSENGNQLTFSSNTSNQDVVLSSLRGASVTVTPYKPAGSSTTKHVMSSSTYYFQQACSVQFSLGSGTLDDAAKMALAGKGFSVEPPYDYPYYNRRVEFTNGGSGQSAAYTDIDLSICNSFNDLAAKVQAALAGAYQTCTVTVDTTTNPNDAKLVISWNRSVTGSSPVIIDGNEGITDGSPVVFEGGINTNHSRKEIDFSSINEDNLDTLLGKGFRINCATCSGEYINVLFCWTKNPEMPAEFKRLDPATREERTIHNIAVELSKVTSADKIVHSIVEQVRPQLQHYTDVAVGDPPTTLIAMEKRVGDVRDNAGTLYLGSVETGVEANFTYSVAHKLVPDLPVGDLDELKTAEVNIYVGSDPEPQVIPIHLPYIDLYHLRLRPPELVDLTASDQDPADWLDRVDRADRAISSARGTIGADYNRLEHAVQDLSNSHIQLSDAYSVIRDTDMAELMMKQVKDQILVQTQQSMMAQANQIPQGVLQLLQ